MNICHLCVALLCLTYISMSFHNLGWLLSFLILHLSLGCRKVKSEVGICVRAGIVAQ